MKSFKRCKSPLQFVLFFAALISFTYCNRPVNNYFVKEIDSISKKFVPDKREGICNVKMYALGKNMILKGETDLPEAKEAFFSFLTKKYVKVVDSLNVLPDTLSIKEHWGLINVSTCNMRINPSHDAEMVSQSIMGTPVKILKKKGGWFMIKTPDSYLGWIDSEAVEPYTTDKYNKWKRSFRVIYLNKTGDISTGHDAGEIVSDIVSGCLLEVTGEENGYYKVLLPDARVGFINKKNCEKFDEWVSKTKPVAENIIATAKKYMGTPYLWGGTSSKGLDCSGFVKTAYYLNGLILARDVSLMFRHGLQIKATLNPDSLRIGDLLFFGSNRNGRIRATHVGMYIGNSEFIHESGMVRINSFDSTRSNFNRFRRDTFLGARRIIGEVTGKGIQLISENSWYK